MSRRHSATGTTGKPPDESTRGITLGELRGVLASIPAPDDEFDADLERIRAAQPAPPIRADDRLRCSE